MAHQEITTCKLFLTISYSRHFGKLFKHIRNILQNLLKEKQNIDIDNVLKLMSRRKKLKQLTVKPERG